MTALDRGAGPTHPGPSHPPPPPSPPPTSITDLAGVIEHMDCALIGLLAVAKFSVEATANSRSVRQVCAEEVLLSRLRLARAAVAELAEAHDLPARQVPPSRPPVGLGSTTRLHSGSGECLTPGSGTAAATAVTESGGSVVDPVAGVQLPGAGEEGRASGLATSGSAGSWKGSRAGADAGGVIPVAPPASPFSLPQRKRFSMTEGPHRLVGVVDPNPSAEQLSLVAARLREP